MLHSYAINACLRISSNCFTSNENGDQRKDRGDKSGRKVTTECASQVVEERRRRRPGGRRSRRGGAPPGVLRLRPAEPGAGRVQDARLPGGHRRLCQHSPQHQAQRNHPALPLHGHGHSQPGVRSGNLLKVQGSIQKP